MGRDDAPVRFRVPRSTAEPLRRGHPWVYRDGVPELAPGRLVEVTDDRNEVLGWGLSDRGPIAARILGRGPFQGPFGAWLKDQVARCDRGRARFVGPDTDAWRVVSGEGDGLPGLVVDRYGSLAVIRLYSAAWESHLDQLLAAVRALPWVTAILRRYGVERVDGRDGSEVLWGPDPGDALVIVERGMKLLARPKTGQKTGLFLDQRESRRWVREMAQGLRVANLFAYNGGFSVAAALGGASRVTTVDIAPQAIDDARENFRLNGLDPDDHEFTVADCFQWRPASPVDLLIVDPPSLSHDADSEGAARNAYKKLHRTHGAHVVRGGWLATSSCTARLPMAAWQEAVAEGLQGTGAWSWVHRHGEPADHPVAVGHREGHYLKFGALVKRDSDSVPAGRPPPKGGSSPRNRPPR